MPTTLLRPCALLLSLSLWGCGDDPSSSDKGPGPSPSDSGNVGQDSADSEAPPPPLVAGAPVAGVAEGLLDLPVGAPLGGYTGRCNCFGNEGEVDKRDSAYVNNFNPSAGVHTRPRAVALWLENGDQDLVILKLDSIYVYEGLVTELGLRLSEATGRDMAGKVMVTGSHSHAMPANFDKGLTWFLGGDRYNPEVFERLATSATDVALEAWDSRQPARIGVGIAKDWDPSDKVYADRRPENNGLQFFEDIPAGAYKDPYLTVIRVDTLEEEPLGLFFAFGIHGTALGGDNQLWSREVIGGMETVLQERFDRPVVVAHWQTAAGDSTPRGSDRYLANIETVGEAAVDPIWQLYSDTPTSAEPLLIEAVSHSVDSSRDNIRVHRPDRVLEYAPYDEDLEPDEILYDEEGKIVTPIDEFNALYGGAFCGEDIPLIPGVSIGTETWPYSSCIDVFTISYVIINFFDMTEADLELPLPESTRIGVGASRIGPVSIREPDGSVVQDDLFMAFLPGEPTAMFTEQLRRRAADELGYAHTLPIGYAQDHMGYLLIPEDWLLGGYEPNINVWGPLQAEHLMEQVLAIGQGWLSTDLREPINPDGAYDPTEYITEWSLPEAPPDSTPGAGLLVEAVPEDFYQPLEGLEVQVAPPASVERVRGSVQLMWEGGDPGVDLPMVTLERQAEDGSWAEVQTAAGRAVTDAEHDMLLLHFPDPLYPFEEAQSHTWWVVWQAVGHVADRAGLPEGTYRLHVTGQHYAGGATTWPWPTTAYEITSEPFLVEPAELTLSWDGSSLRASLDAPAWGYRLVHLEGSSTGSNPLVEPTLTWRMADGSELPAAESPTTSGGASVWTPSVPEGAVSAVVTDQYGNEGQISL